MTVKPPKRDWADWGYWVFSGFLVIVGGLQVWLLLRTLTQIRRQADIYDQQRLQMIKAGEQTDKLLDTMRDTAMREQRAYVCISGSKLGFVRERAPEIHVHIKNFGKTPAYDVRMWIGAALGRYPIPANVRLQQAPADFPKSADILGPGAKPHSMVFQHPVIPEFAMSMLGTSELTMFVHGEVTYRDAFGKERYTRYRLLFGGSEKAILREEKGIWTANLKPDIEGNEAN